MLEAGFFRFIESTNSIILNTVREYPSQGLLSTAYPLNCDIVRQDQAELDECKLTHKPVTIC
jgi:hypothetical protein